MLTVVGARRRRAAVDVLLARHDARAGEAADGLSHEERSVAGAIGDAGERARFLGGRRLLRQALAHHTGRPARDLHIASGRNGQAFLLGGGPFFGLGHCDAWHAIAISDDFPVGVAVAPTAGRPPLGAVVGALLPVDVRERIQRTPSARRDDETLRWWVTMEAAVRACGAGRDQGAACLARVSADVGRPLPEHVVAVAGCTPRTLLVRWHALSPEQADAAA